MSTASSRTTQTAAAGQPQQKDDNLSLAQLLTGAQRGTVATATLDDQRYRVPGNAAGRWPLHHHLPARVRPDLTARLLAGDVDVRAPGGGRE